MPRETGRAEARSRSHIASMSPVITNVSSAAALPGTTVPSAATVDAPPCVKEKMVVSSVFGKQFSKSWASCGSDILPLMRAISASTAGLTNLRSAGAGRPAGTTPPCDEQKARHRATHLPWIRILSCLHVCSQDLVLGCTQYVRA